MSFDGFRTDLTFRYRRSNLNSVTLYVKSPAELYKIGSATEDSSLAILGASRAFQIESIEPTRDYERSMIESGRRYKIGRVGAEIALAIAQKLGLENIILRDPSQGGKDLYTKDLSSIIQARMLTSTRAAVGSEAIKQQLLVQLSRLVRKLKVDFGYNPPARKGCDMLSFVDARQKIRAIVLEVPRQ